MQQVHSPMHACSTWTVQPTMKASKPLSSSNTTGRGGGWDAAEVEQQKMVYKQGSLLSIGCHAIKCT